MTAGMQPQSSSIGIMHNKRYSPVVTSSTAAPASKPPGKGITEGLCIFFIQTRQKIIPLQIIKYIPNAPEISARICMPNLILLNYFNLLSIPRHTSAYPHLRCNSDDSAYNNSLFYL